MWLTPAQKSMFWLLKTYRCLREDQIFKLMELEYKDKNIYFDRQLHVMLELRPYMFCKPLENHIAMAMAEPDTDLLAAIDVMLEFKEHGLEAYRLSRPPFKLVFFKSYNGGKLRAYYVTAVHNGAEFLIPQNAHGAFKGNDNAVFFVLDDMSQKDNIKFPFAHFFATVKDSKIKFSKGVISETL